MKVSMPIVLKYIDMKFILTFFIILFITCFLNAQSTGTVQQAVPELISFNGFTFKKGDSKLNRKSFREEMLASDQASKFYKKGQLNESITLAFVFGGIASLLRTDIDNIYSRGERTKRRLLNTTGKLRMGASALTLKYYLKTIGQ